LVPTWKQAMHEEKMFLSFEEVGSWFRHPQMLLLWDVAGYILKYNLDRSVDRYKARLVVKGYTQTYEIDYFETFSQVAWMNFIRILFSVAVNFSWSLF